MIYKDGVQVFATISTAAALKGSRLIVPEYQKREGGGPVGDER
jgi:hypothetical protein